MPPDRGVKGADADADVQDVILLRPALALAVVVCSSVGTTTPAGATTCRPTPAVLSRTPSVRHLPGGALMRTWDTGPTPSNPRASVRIVAVTLSATSTLALHVRGTGALTRSLTSSTVASRAPSAVAMVNGSVFDPLRGSLPVGPEMLAGRVVKARSTQDPVLTVAPDGTSSPDHVVLRGTVTSGSSSWTVTGLNWQSVTGGGVNVWTTAWGSDRRPYGATDVVVQAGKVTAVRTGTARGAAPASGQTVLSSTGTQLSHLHVGSPVSLSYRAEHDAGHPVSEELGRGARYLLHGTEQGGDCSDRDEQLRPRTAVAWDRAGRPFLLTVSGRSLEHGVIWGGATHHQMPDYLAQLGAYDAAGMDGGGSTAMVVRYTQGGTPVRVDRLDGTAQRPTPNFVSFG